MTTAVQLRRGTTAEHATFTGLEGETTVDTTKTTLVVHNGSTAGGFAIAREDLANVTPTNLPTITGDATAADDKFLIYDQSALTLKQITRAELNNAIEQDPLSNVQIISGTINGTTIGGTTAAGGSFTTLNSSGATTLNGTTIPSSVTLVSTAATQTLTNKTLTSPTISGGTLNNISIGASSASTGAFTTLAYTGTLTGGTGVINIGSGQLYKDASGNVGIGTSSPDTALHVRTGQLMVNGTANDGATIQTSSGGGLSQLQSNDGSNANFRIQQGTNSTGVITFGTRTGGSNLERVRIDNAGNVGIGTSSPANRFQTTLSGAGNPYVGINQTGDNPYIEFQRFTGTGSNYGGSRLKTNGNPDLIFETSNQATIGSQTFTERMRIDSAGRVLVGATAVRGGWFNTTGTTVAPIFQIDGTTFNNSSICLSTNQTSPGEASRILLGRSRGTTAGSFTVVQSGDELGSVSFQGADGSDFVEAANIKVFVDGTPGANDMPGRLVFFTTADGASSPTERMRIDSTGNVGIGTTGPSFTSGGGLMVQNGTQANLRLDHFLNGGFEIQSASGTLRFYSTAASAERMRIDSSGALLVGTTANPAQNVAGIKLEKLATQAAIFMSHGTRTTFSEYFYFYNGNGLVGSISSSGSATTYSTSSDYRLKHDIQPMTGALAKVAQLKPVTYKWNADDSESQGFIAHELQEVVPECVTGEKDAVDADGKPVYQGIDTSFLVATLTAAIQEQQAIIEQLKARLDAANL
jgi:hypothetical protein